jgi:hypothetical protein
MNWIRLAGLSALFEFFRDVASKRSRPLIDVYLILRELSALMPVVLGGVLELGQGSNCRSRFSEYFGLMRAC